MLRELRLALRTLRRRPVFSLAVVLTLAIGLGANTTIFSVVDSVLLRSLPYPDAERLMAVWETVEREPGRPESVERRAWSLPDLNDARVGMSSLEALAGYDLGSFRLGGERPERIIGTTADAAYLEVLGVEPILGSGLSDEPGGAEGVAGVVLSHSLWQSRFGGRRDVVGEPLVLNGEPAEVAGVLPAGFRGLVDGSELWYPMAFAPEGLRDARDARWLSAVARLAPGASVEQANHELDALFAALEERHPEDNRAYRAAGALLADELVGSVRSPLLLLWAAVTAVLLVAAINVVNLLLVQLRGRAGDIAISRALGASRLHLMRRFLWEGLLLAGAGAVVGLGLGALGLRALRPIAPVDLPALFTVDLGVRATAFSLALALLLGVVVGVAATLRSTLGGPVRGHAVEDLRTTGRDAARSGLLVAQVALATLLTVAAGLLVRSFWSLSDVDPGMIGTDVGMLQLDLREGRDEMELPAAREAALTAARSVPGVELAALSSDAPFSGPFAATVVSPEGRERSAEAPYSGATRVYRHLVSPDYFRVLEIAVLRGRTFDRGDALPADDDSRGPGAPGVAVVSEELAATLWPEDDALGQRFYLGSPVESVDQGEGRPWFEVVGIVADHRQRSLIPAPEIAEDPDVFFAMEQFNPAGATLLFRSGLPTEELAAALGRELAAADPRLVTFAPGTLETLIAQETARPRFSGLLMSTFSLLSLLLAALGIYGVVANTVELRRREIGIRMALGADRERVLREVVLPSVALIGLGIGLGLLAAVGAGRFLETQVYEVGTRDPRVFAVSLLVLGTVGFLASLLPARRASRFHPVEALRSE